MVFITLSSCCKYSVFLAQKQRYGTISAMLSFCLLMVHIDSAQARRDDAVVLGCVCVNNHLSGLSGDCHRAAEPYHHSYITE